MAEEDLIFGKNRHMFGGIEPSNMLGFEIASRINAVKILTLLPEDTTIDGQTLCTVAGAIIRRRTDKYPVDEFDGDLVADVKVSGFVIDNSAKLSNTYYYAAFPYTTQGVYNRCSENRVKYIPSDSYYIYGFDLDTENPDPDSRVVYPSDVLNANFTPAKFFLDDTITKINYGDWPSTFGEGFMPRPCMLKKDGTVDYYLDPTDYTKKVDGTSSDIYDGDYDGNAMMEWPKIYTKRELVDGIYKFRCASKKIDDSYECWCNYDINNNEIDHFYTSITNPCKEIWENDRRWVLKSTYAGSVNNRHDRHNDPMYQAGLNGPDWTIETLSDHLLIQDLLVMMARSTDCKTAYNGVTIGVFGMHEYESQREIAGWVFDTDDRYRIKLTRGTKDGSTATDYNYTGEGYLSYDLDESDLTGNHVGHVSKCKVESYGRIPIGFEGSSTTYECDEFNRGRISGTDYAGNCMALISDWYSSDDFGLFGARLNLPSSYVRYGIGASLSCKPRKTT